MPFAITKKLTGTNHYNKLDLGLGVEIELAEWGGVTEALIEGGKYATLSQQMNAQKIWDRSVVPSNNELVVGPLYGDAFLRGMAKLINVLLKENASVNNSCSVHTHIADSEALDCSAVHFFFSKHLVRRVRKCSHFFKKVPSLVRRQIGHIHLGILLLGRNNDYSFL